MRATLKQIFSLDVDDLASWRPTDEDFGLDLRLVVGPDDDEGEESFDLTVCTPGWLREHVTGQKVLDLRHHLLVERYDWPTVEEYLIGRVSRCEGATWDAVAACVGRLGHWEFEDYRDH